MRTTDYTDIGETFQSMTNVKNSSLKRSSENSDTGYQGSKRLRISTTNFKLKNCPENFLNRNENYYKKTINEFPQLLRLMYQIDLSILCTIRKINYEPKYHSLSILFDHGNKFSDVVFQRSNKKSIHLKIENILYGNKIITYSRLFTNKKQEFSIQSYFESFVYHSETIDNVSNIKYLVLYTDSCLDLTEENKLKNDNSINFFPFKFDRLKKRSRILKHFLFINDDDGKDQYFCQLSRDEINKKELYKRLEFSFTMRKMINDQKFETELKELFLKKFLIAVNQPGRKKLNKIVQNEAKNDYAQLRERILFDLKTSKNNQKLLNGIFKTNLLMLNSHDMFLNGNIFSINFTEENDEKFCTIKIDHKLGFTILNALSADCNIGYNQLFPNKQQNDQTFSIHRFFTFFNEENCSENLKYFVIYTNAHLDLTKENRLKKGRLKEFHCIEFDIVNVEEEKYEILKDFSCLYKNGLYRIAKDEKNREYLLNILIEKEKGRCFNDIERKEEFLDKLIFAVDQPDDEILKVMVKNGICKSNTVLYDYEKLHEVTLRMLESNEFGFITKNGMEKYFENYRRLSQKIHNQNIDDVAKFSEFTVGKIEAVKNLDGKNKKFSQKIQNQNTDAVANFPEFTVGKIEAIKNLDEENKKFSQKIQNQNIDDGAKFSEFTVEKIKAEKNVILENKKFSKKIQNVNDVAKFTEFELGDKIKTEKNFILENKKIRQKVQNGDAVRFVRAVTGDIGSDEFSRLLNFLLEGEGRKYFEIIKRDGKILSSMSCILHNTRRNASEAFKDLYNLWFDENENKTMYLKTLEEEEIKLSVLSSILSGAKNNAATAFKDLYGLWFDSDGKKSLYLQTLSKEGINLSNISSILSRSATNAKNAFTNLYHLWFDSEGKKTKYLKSFENEGIHLSKVSSILAGARMNAPVAFLDLYRLWFDENGNKTPCLDTMKREGINLGNVSSILSKAGAKAPHVFKAFYELWFDSKGEKSHYLKTIEKEGINLSNISSILHGAGVKAPEAFEDLYNLWFDEQGRKRCYLIMMEKEGINLASISNILHSTGRNASIAFKNLYYLWFESDEGKKTVYLMTLKKNKINLAHISSILSGSGVNAPSAFKDLYQIWFDEDGNKTKYLKTLEENGIYTSRVSSILSKAGKKVKDAFINLYNFWFDKKGQKTKYLITLENEGINLVIMSSILHGAGAKAPQTFKELYDSFFDSQGHKTIELKHLTSCGKFGEKNFTLHNLSGILSKAGAQAKCAFENFHKVCFDANGNKTPLLSDFYNAGFEPSNLSCILCNTGSRASKVLIKFHKTCFNKKGEKSKILNDFYDVGFRACDLCNIMSAAACTLEIFHRYCFIDKTKKYLTHFLKDGFTPRELSKILHGAGSKICIALKEFHNVCFDKAGNKRKILGDFQEAGFTTRDLSIVLSITGNNATSVLKDFHKCCFSEENYLEHFLNIEEFLTPNVLSKVLNGAGTKICQIFVKLHDICFDKKGNKTDYFETVIRNKSSNEISTILHSKVRKCLPTFLDSDE